MSDWATLSRGFDYDLWANTLWLECLEAKGRPEPDFGIFRHILSAQKVWVVRCAGTSVDRMLDVEPRVEAMTELSNEWKAVLQTLSHDPVIDYKRLNGDAHTIRVSEIVQHVQNHGTYHRGELRGLCRSRDDQDFPETDRARFSLIFPA